MPLLSHYTGRAGLEGIASSQCFWATNFLDLNDNSEFFYAWEKILRDAYEETMKHVPDSIKLPGYDISKQARVVMEQFRNVLRAQDGYGHLYVTSFARASTEDHERRGLLTLWDRYTQHRGYCLQFERSDLEQLLQLDSYKSNYGVVGLHPVKYGVDRNSLNYRELVFQMTQVMLRDIARTRNDVLIEPAYDKMWPESTLHRRVMEYCAVHKDPCFEDERELRLFCYPSQEAESRVLTGIASKKIIRKAPNGKRYIVIGEHWRPGIVPRRILVGTYADRDIGSVLALYDFPPRVEDCGLPIVV